MIDDIIKVQELTKEVIGWLALEQGKFLYQQAKKCSKDNAIVEIGSWQGKSTIWLGRGSLSGNKSKVYAVDPHKGTDYCVIKKVENTFPFFLNNIKKAGLLDIVEPIVLTSVEASKSFDKKIELLFIDGAHDYKNAKLDFESWFPKLIIGGTILFHDSGGRHPGVSKTVKEKLYDSDCVEHLKIIHGMAYAIKKK